MKKGTAAMDSPVKSARKERWDKLFNHLVDEYILRGEMPLKDLLSYIEVNLLVLTLKKSNGSQQKAAKILGIRNTTLHEKMKKNSIGLRKVLFFDEERQN